MDIGVRVPEILLPGKEVDFGRWAVVACDQFTSQPEYWERLAGCVGDAPSSYHITFPEVYLGGRDGERIRKINDTMKSYLQDGVFAPPLSCFVLVSRELPYSGRRTGLMLSVDLEKYSVDSREKPLIRATEGTVLSRIPPRVRIREGAPLELPHIMLLIDDPEKSVIEPLYEDRERLEKLYDFELNMGGGRVSGWRVDDTAAVIRRLEALLNPGRLQQRYGEDAPFLFAVGDGNHSLATAKACWESLKTQLTPDELSRHPARYALCEAVNVYDPGLRFSAIHRVVFGVKPEFVRGLGEFFAADAGRGVCLLGGRQWEIPLPESAPDAVGRVQEYIDAQIACGNAEKVDYVHGEASVREITAKREDTLGILLPAMDKSELFAAVAKHGALPRKTFSMGEAVEKRYYLEARRIVE